MPRRRKQGDRSHILRRLDYEGIREGRAPTANEQCSVPTCRMSVFEMLFERATHAGVQGNLARL